MAHLIRDIEPGDYYEVTEEQHKAMQYFRERMMQFVKPDNLRVGKIFITSTSADGNEEQEDMKKLWTNG